mgnify:CR=1 FL=1
MKKKIMLASLAVICTILLTGCGNAKLKNGEDVAITVNGTNITANDIYKKLRDKYGISTALDMVDKEILDTIYKDDATIEKQAANQIESLKSQYSDSWEDTLKNAGYESEKDLKEYFILNYQRNQAIEDQIKDNIKDDEIKKYYEENTVGDISAKHILIKVDTDSEDGLTDDEAKKKAEEIIKKLDKGEDFDTLAKENSDDTGSKEKGGDLGYFNKGDMVKEFETAAYKLKVNEYTKKPVKTKFGYHIILRVDQKDKAKLKDVKSDIKEKLTAQKLSDDKSLYYQTLIKYRESKKITWKDDSLKKQYNDYMDKLIENAKSSSSN